MENTNLKNKIIVVFEGLSCVGKTKTIKAIMEDLELNSKYRCITYSKQKPNDVRALYNSRAEADENYLVVDEKEWIHALFRFSRIGININEAIKNPNFDILLLDRGLLTAYISGIIGNVDAKFLDKMTNCLQVNFDAFNYFTVVFKSDLKSANARLRKRKNNELAMAKSKIQIENINQKFIKKLNRNKQHFNFYQKIQDFKFLGKVLEVPMNSPEQQAKNVIHLLSEFL